uniref:Importin N-terminal domain-containing protein n=1 Tax=Romanomermis culicivorax TaxID=13658 RepID=A0A915KPT7_ROMCU
MTAVLDEKHLTAALKASLDAQERENAENYLNAVTNIIGYTPALLKIVVDENVECPVRQAAIILLKNLISAHWNDDHQNTNEDKKGEKQQQQGALIHEQDRHLIRQSIVESIINCPEVIRLQLAVCVSRIIKNDFPHRWPQVVEKIVQNLNVKSCQNWLGALVVLYQLVKAYEFKKPEEREVLVEAMKHIMPLLYTHMNSLMQDQSQEACYLQKIILKIFYALVQFSLNLNLLSIEQFAQWMHIIHTVVERPVPAETLNVDEEDRPNLIFWKCKKWASRTMSRIFERYGNPGQVAAEYNQFAENYLKNFVAPALRVVLKVLEDYRSKIYVSPPVLYQILNYLQSAVAHSFSWKLLKAHMLVSLQFIDFFWCKHIITEIVFPLSCHNDADQELWDSDPQEYVRVKYDLLSELIDPASAAVALLSESVKRKDVLNKTIQFLGGVLTAPQSTGRQLDGALHMLGTLAPNLLK